MCTHFDDCKGMSGAKRACQGFKSIMDALGGSKNHPSTARLHHNHAGAKKCYLLLYPGPMFINHFSELYIRSCSIGITYLHPLVIHEIAGLKHELLEGDRTGSLRAAL